MEKEYSLDTVLIKLIYYCNIKREVYFKRKNVTDFLIKNSFFEIPNKQGFDGNLSYFGFDIQNDSDNNRILVLRGNLLNKVCLNGGFGFSKNNNHVILSVDEEYSTVFNEIDTLIKNKTNESKAFKAKIKINTENQFEECNFRVFGNQKIYKDNSYYYYYPKVIINPENGQVAYEIVNSTKLLELNPKLVFPKFDNDFRCTDYKTIKYEDFFYNETLGSGEKDFYYFILNAQEAEEINILQLSDEVIIEIINEHNYDLSGRETTMRVLSNIRLNTGTLRAKALSRDGNKCQLCDISDSKLLICSHIQPWRTGTARLDLNNVITLCTLHDALFDKGYITFDNEGNIILSGNSVLRIDPIASFLGKSNIKLSFTMNSDMLRYVTFHRKNIFNS